VDQADLCLVNGESQNRVSVADRGLQYGDGLFETLAVRDGRPQLWDRHLRRMAEGCRRLRIQMPEPDLLANEAHRLCTGRGQGVLKLIVTRGSGGRGYGPLLHSSTTRILSLYPWPAFPTQASQHGVRVRFCETRLGINPRLAGLKHLNRLEQVLARLEWDDPSIVEGLMLDQGGRVIEGTMSNLFAVYQAKILTPQLMGCGVAGVMRQRILELLREIELPCRITQLMPEDLRRANELFLCNSVIGVWPISHLEGRQVPGGPMTQRIACALQGALERA
jgi:4-amino-4-deoxychorismate lyase